MFYTLPKLWGKYKSIVSDRNNQNIIMKQSDASLFMNPFRQTTYTNSHKRTYTVLSLSSNCYVATCNDLYICRSVCPSSLTLQSTTKHGKMKKVWAGLQATLSTQFSWTCSASLLTPWSSWRDFHGDLHILIVSSAPMPNWPEDILARTVDTLIRNLTLL